MAQELGALAALPGSRVGFQFPAPTLGGSQLLTAPTPGNLTPSSYLLRHLDSQAHKHAHTIKNKIF